MFEESSAGEEPFENLNDENNFDEVQDALENSVDILCNSYLFVDFFNLLIMNK